MKLLLLLNAFGSNGSTHVQCKELFICCWVNVKSNWMKANANSLNRFGMAQKWKILLNVIKSFHSISDDYLNGINLFSERLIGASSSKRVKIIQWKNWSKTLKDKKNWHDPADYHTNNLPHWVYCITINVCCASLPR